MKMYSLSNNQNSDLDLVINVLLSLHTPLLSGHLIWYRRVSLSKPADDGFKAGAIRTGKLN